MLKIDPTAPQTMVLDASELEAPYRSIPGFSVTVKRPTPVHILAARTAAFRARQKVKDEAGIVIPPDPIEAGKVLADHPEIQAAGEWAFTLALAVFGIVAWEGIGGRDGEPLKVTPENVHAALQNQAVFDFIDRKYVGTALAQDDEKNVSSPSRNTTSRRANRTAKGAGKRAAKPAPTAPTS